MYAIIRLKYLLVEYGETIAVGCLLLAVVGGGAAGWFYTHPQTETVTTHHDEQTAVLDVETGAVIRGDRGVFPAGTHVRNKPFYLYTSAPNLTLHVKTAIEGASRATITHRVQIVYKAVDDTGRSSAVYWTDARTVTEETLSGTSVTSTPSIDIASVQSRRNQIESTLGDAAHVTAALRVQTQYQSETYSGNLSKTIPVTFNERSYVVSPVTVRTDYSTTDTNRLVVERPTWQYVVTLGLGSLGLVGFLLAVVASYRLERSPRRRHELHRRRYSEWLSAGSLPDEITTEMVVHLDSLEDLIDVAIDRNERVIYDPAKEVYLIPGAYVAYWFDPGTKSSR